jgi:hypothetical protein
VWWPTPYVIGVVVLQSVRVVLEVVVIAGFRQGGLTSVDHHAKALGVMPLKRVGDDDGAIHQ